MEVLFIGFLQAALTHFSVHFVAGDFLVIVPLLFAHSTHMTQQMGSIGGVIFANGGRLDGKTGNIQLHDDRETLVIGVFHKHIVGKRRDTVTKTHFITQADDLSGLVFRQLFGDLIDLPELFHQKRCGNIGVDVTLNQKCLEILLPGGVILVQGIYKGLLRGYREMIRIGDILLFTGFNQILNVGVGSAGRQQNIMVQHQVVTGSVTYQLIAVDVQNIASGCFYAGDGGKGGGIIHHTAGLHDLQVVHSVDEEGQHQTENQQQKHRPDTAYSFHTSPPILLMALTKG